MAKIKIQSKGLEMSSLKVKGTDPKVGGGVKIKFKEATLATRNFPIEVHLTHNEADDILASLAVFLGYDFVKKEAV
jgi:hypothetical protein